MGEHRNVRAFVEEKLENHPGSRRFNVERGFIGFYTTDHLPQYDRIAFFYLPRNQDATLDGLAQSGHENRGCHGYLPLNNPNNR
jgi:hypothetical protein